MSSGALDSGLLGLLVEPNPPTLDDADEDGSLSVESELSFPLEHAARLININNASNAAISLIDFDIFNSPSIILLSSVSVFEPDIENYYIILSNKIQDKLLNRICIIYIQYNIATD